MGFKTQFVLYGYYILTAALLRATSPPLSLMTAQETALGGALRAAHQRLVVHAEEVAFNDPPGGLTERYILNQHLGRLLRHSRLSALQQFAQQVHLCMDVGIGSVLMVVGWCNHTVLQSLGVHD